MTARSLPAVAEVVPHRGPMLLLTRILEHTSGHTVCAVDVTPASPFLTGEGVVPAWVGLEYLAQCIAAHAGLAARAKGQAPRVGFLLGTRRLHVLTGGFRPGQCLVVRVAHLWGDGEMASFACELRDRESDTLLLEGKLSVVLPDTLDRFQHGGRAWEVPV